MTTLNTLFLPLLGGFLFFYISHWTAYFAANQPAQPVLFFSAFTGLCLLIVARLITYYCEQPSFGHLDGALQVGAIAIPPFLLIITLGWGVATLQSGLERTSISKTKATLSIAATLLSAVVLVHIERATDHLPNIWGVPHPIFWFVAFALLCALAIPWSRVSSMPLSVVLVRAATLAIVILMLSYWILPRLPKILGIWGGVTQPIGDSKAVEGLGTAFLACVLGPILALCFNVIYSKEGAAARLVRRGWATGLEQLIYLAARRNKPVMLTLDDHKVYVGLVESVFANQRAARDSYVKILPLMSGYRNEETHRVHFTTYYRRVYRAIERGGKAPAHTVLSPVLQAQFQKVLPIERIVSAGSFDSRYYDSFQQQHSDPAAGDAADKPRERKPDGTGGLQKGLRLRGTVQVARPSVRRNREPILTVDVTAKPE